MTDLLVATGLKRSYGGVHAVRDVSLRWRSGAIHGLMGPNGAGKSTVLNLITGLSRPEAGTVQFQGTDVTGRKPWQIARAGVSRTFQTSILDDEATVLDNVAVGAHSGHRYGPPWGLLPSRRSSRIDREVLAQSRAALTRLGLAEAANRPAKQLSYGERRLVEVARASVASPKLLLLDEPAAGLPHSEAIELGRTLQRLVGETGMTVVLIEHNVRMVVDICDEITVLVEGAVIESGSPSAVLASRAVIESYMGTKRTEGWSRA
ncbi:ABC transporter ATP-binding protein [Nocardioides sp. AN3]